MSVWGRVVSGLALGYGHKRPGNQTNGSMAKLKRFSAVPQKTAELDTDPSRKGNVARSLVGRAGGARSDAAQFPPGELRMGRLARTSIARMHTTDQPGDRMVGSFRSFSLMGRTAACQKNSEADKRLAARSLDRRQRPQRRRRPKRRHLVAGKRELRRPRRITPRPCTPRTRPPRICIGASTAHSERRPMSWLPERRTQSDGRRGMLTCSRSWWSAGSSLGAGWARRHRGSTHRAALPNEAESSMPPTFKAAAARSCSGSRR